MTTKQAIETLQSAQDYLLNKSYPGDDGGSLMHYWDWNVVTCEAIGILDETISRIYLEAK